jgi:hypothetical protein
VVSFIGTLKDCSTKVTPMSRLDYVKQTDQSVGVTYTDMPAQTELVYVNVTSGAKSPAPSNALGKGGDGAADIPIDRKLAAGQYYLLAQSQATKEYIAQTIAFYIN